MEKNRQQQKLYENKIHNLNKECTSLSNTILQRNKTLSELNFKIAQLMQKLKDNGYDEIVKEEKAWYRITEFVFSQKECTSIHEKLISNLLSNNEIPYDVSFFLSSYCNNMILMEAIQKCEKMAVHYKASNIIKQEEFLYNVNIPYINYAEFDAYCIEDAIVVEILSYVFFLISLVEPNVPDLLKIKLTQVIYALSIITYESWDAELCLCENDT